MEAGWRRRLRLRALARQPGRATRGNAKLDYPTKGESLFCREIRLQSCTNNHVPPILMPPPTPATKRAQIIAALEANPNASAVARQIGSVSIETVTSIAHQAKITLPRGGRWKLPAEEQARIIASLKKTPNARAVSKQHGVSYAKVYKLAKRENIQLRSRGPQRV
jgi:hypothetical protein